jgi:hypothetical protein
VQVLKWLQIFVVAGLGFTVAVFPEVTIGAFGVIGLLILLRERSLPKPTLFLIVPFLLGWLPLVVHGINNWLNLLLGVFAVGLLTVFNKLAPWHSWLTRGIFVGLLVMFVVFSMQTFGFLPNQTWSVDPSMVKEEILSSSTKFVAVEPNNAWILHLIDFQGSGKIEYQIDLKTSTQKQVNIFLAHPKIRKDVLCDLKTEWTTCKIEIEMPDREFTYFGIGGFSTWKVGDPPLEMRNPRVIIIQPPTLTERFSSFSRSAGFAFNFNAFGAHMAIVGLLAAILAPNLLWAVVAICPAIFCVFMSGSRGALVAFGIGLVVLLFARTRFYKTLPWFFIVFCGLTMFLLVYNTQIPPKNQSITAERSLDLTKKDFASDRLYIWRLAIKAWVENPQTFLLGTGDLSAAMTQKLDKTTNKFVLGSEGLTHAHNLWLQTAGESGLLGLSIMLVLWGWVVLKAWRARDSGALALLAAIFVINSVDYLFFYAPVHLCFWIAAAGFKKSFEDSINNLPAKLETLQ